MDNFCLTFESLDGIILASIDLYSFYTTHVGE